MAIKLNNIYIGTNKGEIRVYSWKTEKKLNYLINSEIEQERKQDVICMDVSEDNKVLVVGHLNGYILLWDVNTAECKKIIQDEFKSQIVAIKFTLVENHFYDIFR
jgi:WD40 repeat protein